MKAGRVKKCTLATLGWLDPLDGGLDTIINGLFKACLEHYRMR